MQGDISGYAIFDYSNTSGIDGFDITKLILLNKNNPDNQGTIKTKAITK